MINSKELKEKKTEVHRARGTCDITNMCVRGSQKEKGEAKRRTAAGEIKA